LERFLEARTAAAREQMETLLQRASDNLADWAELRQRLVAISAAHQNTAERLDQSTARVDELQAKTEERTTHDKMVLARLDDTAAKVQELQTQLNTHEDAFAGVLRRHARALAELRESIVGRNSGPRHPAEVETAPPREPATGGAPGMPRRFQPPVRLFLGEAAPDGRLCYRVAPTSSGGADLIAEFSELPFESAGVSEIHAGDLLERSAPRDVRRLLSHWSQLLWAGGSLRVLFTDLEAAERTYAHVSSAFGELSRAILSQRGDRRRAFNREAVHRLLRESGFQDITEQPNEDPGAHGFHIEIRAIRSGGQSA
jgi:hypothetical protein